MTELRIVPDVLPIAPIVFTDAGYYWRGAAAYANDLFKVFDNMIRVKCDTETIVRAVEEKLESIKSESYEEPALGILRDDDEGDLILEDTDAENLVRIWKESL